MEWNSSLLRLRNCNRSQKKNNTPNKIKKHTLQFRHHKNLIELSEERIKMSLCLIYKHLADNKRLRPKEIACHDSLEKKIPKSHHLALDQWITDWANNRSS